MFIKFLKLVLVILLYQVPLYSKNKTLNDLNSRYLSNYFSGIIAYENKDISEALKFFKLSKRLINNKVYRPIIQDVNNLDSMSDYIAKHLFERNYYYNQASNVIRCDFKDKEEIANEIVNLSN